MPIQLNRRQALAVGAGAALLTQAHVNAWADETYPSRPIRFILPFSAGGGTDANARVLAEELQKVLKVPILCDNKPGASGAIAVQATLAAPADGYTLLIATNSVVSVNPVAMKNLNYDPFKDLTPVHGMTVSPAMISAPRNSPYSTVKDALLRAKASGQPLRIGNYSQGYELLAAWVGYVENVPIIHVPYKGPANMLVDLVGDRLDFAISDPTSALELIKGGKLRGMAICADKRDPTIADVPTMKEQGYTGFESYVWSSVFAKAGTPPAALKILADQIGVANRSPAVEALRSGLPRSALNLALGDMGKFQRDEYERFKKVAQAVNYEPR